MLLVTLALVLAIGCSSAALARTHPSLSILLVPRHPASGGHYTITLKGRAPTGGKLGKNHNRTELDIIEQLGGSCASTPQGELSKSGIADLGPLYVKAGKFNFSQKRTAASTPGTTIRFCGYLSKGLHTLVAKATIAYSV